MTHIDTPSTTNFGPDTFRHIMRAPASSVAIVATGEAEFRAGCTVTAICSLSDSPPSLLVCLHRHSSVLETIMRNRRFSANYLGDGQSDIADVFAGRTGKKGHERFSDDWEQSSNGLPILRDATAVFECRLTESNLFGSHAILCAQIIDGSRTDVGCPLLYCEGDYGRFA